MPCSEECIFLAASLAGSFILTAEEKLLPGIEGGSALRRGRAHPFQSLPDQITGQLV